MSPCREVLCRPVPGRGVDVVAGRRKLKDSIILDVQVRVNQDIEVPDLGTDECFVESADKYGCCRSIRVG